MTKQPPPVWRRVEPVKQRQIPEDDAKFLDDLLDQSRRAAINLPQFKDGYLTKIIDLQMHNYDVKPYMQKYREYLGGKQS